MLLSSGPFLLRLDSSAIPITKPTAPLSDRREQRTIEERRKFKYSEEQKRKLDIQA